MSRIDAAFAMTLPSQLRQRLRLIGATERSSDLSRPVDGVARGPAPLRSSPGSDSVGRPARDSTGDPSDEELLVLAHSRAEGVETLLYRRFRPLVNRLVWHLLGPDSEYQDTIHDVFIRIFHGIGRVREAARLQDWAARVAVNTVKNVFRRRALRRFLPWNAGSDLGVLLYQTDFEHRELLHRTYRILETLPAGQRIALSLDLFEPVTIDDIALQVGVSVRTIKRRLKAARERFYRAADRDPLLSQWLRDRPQGVR
jgi:RNA polymerase sigma-70 factor, ECF subfamily